jgi:hypothetical protein
VQRKSARRCYQTQGESYQFEVLSCIVVLVIPTLSHFSLSVAINEKGGDCWHMDFGVVIDGNPSF